MLNLKKTNKFLFIIICVLVFAISCNGCFESKQKKTVDNGNIFLKEDNNKKNLSIDKNNENNIENNILNSQNLCITFFYFKSCEYCKKFIPIFLKLSEDPDLKNVKFYGIKLSLDSDIREEQKNSIRKLYKIDTDSFPHVQIFNEGKSIHKFQSDEKYRTYDSIKEKLLEQLASKKH